MKKFLIQASCSRFTYSIFLENIVVSQNLAGGNFLFSLLKVKLSFRWLKLGSFPRNIKCKELEIIWVNDFWSTRSMYFHSFAELQPASWAFHFSRILQIIKLVHFLSLSLNVTSPFSSRHSICQASWNPLGMLIPHWVVWFFKRLACEFVHPESLFEHAHLVSQWFYFGPMSHSRRWMFLLYLGDFIWVAFAETCQIHMVGIV